MGVVEGVVEEGGVPVGPVGGPTGRFSWVFFARGYREWTYGKVVGVGD